MCSFYDFYWVIHAASKLLIFYNFSNEICYVVLWIFTQFFSTFYDSFYFQAVNSRGGRFLEASVCGSKEPASRGELIIVASGDEELFDDCYSCFEAMGKKSFYLG